MTVLGIMANGPRSLLPDLATYKKSVDVWISADGGALTLIDNEIEIDYAVGDFDSVTSNEKTHIIQVAKDHKVYSTEKDLTDIEIALLKAFEYNPTKIYLFGATGGRLDHELINIQLLYFVIKKGVPGIIVDKQNIIELTTPNRYQIEYNPKYPNISFIPFSQVVKGLTLEGFYYPLNNQEIQWGSTLCISNKLLSNHGSFTYTEGLLIIIKSRDEELVDLNEI